MTHDSVFDEDEVNQWIARTEQIRDGLNEEVAKLEAVYTSAVREASLHTENGEPAPVYAPILKALRARIDHAKAQVGQSARNIDTDNTTLRRWMKAQQQNAEDTKARVQNIDTDSAFDRAAARTMADGRLEQRLGIARDLSGTSIKGDDGRFHSVDQKTADAIDAGLAAAPDTKTYTFSDTDGNIHRSAPR